MQAPHWEVNRCIAVRTSPAQRAQPAALPRKSTDKLSLPDVTLPTSSSQKSPTTELPRSQSSPVTQLQTQKPKSMNPRQPWLPQQAPKQ